MKTRAFLAFAILSIYSCQNEELVQESNYDPSKFICITTNAEMLSRGTPIDTESQMSNLGLFGAYTGQTNWSSSVSSNKLFNRQLNRNSLSGKWDYATGIPEKWNATKANDKYTFFAYAPYGTGLYHATNNASGNGIAVNGSAATAGVPSLNYTVPQNCTNQPDLMIALPRKDIMPSPSPVRLSMQHALTSVGFKISGNGEKINKIQLSGAKTSGTLSVDGSTINWSNLTTDGLFEAKVNSSIIVNGIPTTINTTDGYLMMIPQTLPNTAKVTLTLSDGTTREVGLSQQVWSAGKNIHYTIAITPQGAILLTPDKVVIPAVGIGWSSNPITVTCELPNQSWTITTPATWISLSLSPLGTGAGQSVTGTGTQTIYLFAGTNANTINRTTTLQLNGNSVVNITQVKTTQTSTLPGGGLPPANSISYVGAFWRANQKGERIIRIPMGIAIPLNTNIGPWNATVAWMDASWNVGDIVLSSLPSTDPNVDFTTIKTPGNAESYPVAGNALSAWGEVQEKGIIYFRIGLKSTFTPTEAKPARYAVVLLQYGNPQQDQLIFLRQGEDPDYLMRTSESSSTLVNRPQAKKFSAFNLTATTMTAGGSNLTNHPQLNTTTNKGTFTQYPTQAGAIFQWANLVYPRYAFHPINTASGITNWPQLVGTSPAWDAGISPNRLSDILETCPKSYTLNYNNTIVNFRRPNNGTTLIPTTDILNLSASELAQSLWNTLPTISTPSNMQNSSYGYYADGFFDRRMTVSTALVINGNENRAVLWGDKDVAYAGTLFFNPVTNASLFFPAVGIRYSRSSSTLMAAGTMGYYWSSTTADFNNAWSIFLSKETSAIGRGHKDLGYSIRCVRE